MYATSFAGNSVGRWYFPLHSSVLNQRAWSDTTETAWVFFIFIREFITFNLLTWKFSGRASSELTAFATWINVGNNSFIHNRQNVQSLQEFSKKNWIKYKFSLWIGLRTINIEQSYHFGHIDRICSHSWLLSFFFYLRFDRTIRENDLIIMCRCNRFNEAELSHAVPSCNPQVLGLQANPYFSLVVHRI